MTYKHDLSEALRKTAGIIIAQFPDHPVLPVTKGNSLQAGRDRVAGCYILIRGAAGGILNEKQ